MQKGIAKSIVKKFRKTVLDNTASSGNGIMGNSTKNMTDQKQPIDKVKEAVLNLRELNNASN